MSKELATHALFADALAGRIDRRVAALAPQPSVSARRSRQRCPGDDACRTGV